MQDEISILFIVLSSAILALLLAVFITVFLLISQKRSFKYQQNMQEMEKKYGEELLRAQVEVQTSTLNQISEEIHDNIGQLLSVAKLNLSSVNRISGEQALSVVNETKGIINDIIAEIRYLSKSISSKHIADFGLLDAIRTQLIRINKSGQIEAELKVEGRQKSFGPQIELLLFRTVQELMNNAIKHSRCKKIDILARYSPDNFTLEVKDDGIGFNVASKSNNKDGSGLYYLGLKAKIIGCTLHINSEENRGTSAVLVKTYTESSHA